MRNMKKLTVNYTLARLRHRYIVSLTYSDLCMHRQAIRVHSINMVIRTADRLKILIAIICAIKTFNHDYLHQNKKHMFMAQNSSIIHDTAKYNSCKTKTKKTKIHFTTAVRVPWCYWQKSTNFEMCLLTEIFVQFCDNGSIFYSMKAEKIGQQ